MNKLPQLGICTGPENKQTVDQAGADFLEVNVQSFLVPRDDDETFASQHEATRKLDFPVLCANCFLPGALPCVGPSVDEAALLAYAETAFARAKMVGIETIVFGSGASRNIPEGYSPERAREQFTSLLKKIAPLAEGSAVTIVIEPLNTKECNFIHTLAEGAGIVEDCAHPSVQLLADTYHMGFSGEGPDTLRQFGKYIRHVHIAESPSRRAPGTNGANFRGYFEALQDIGYRGRVSMECNWEDLAREARPALESVRRDFAAAGY